MSLYQHYCLSNKKGFTLLEILTAMAMFAVVTAALFSMFFSTMKLRDASHEALETSLSASHAVETLKRDLTLCIPPGGLMAGDFLGEKQETGSERSDTLEMFTAAGRLTGAEPWGDVMQVSYALEEPEDDTAQGMVLTRSIQRNLLPATEEEDEPEGLIDHVQSFQLSYYDGEAWTDSWDSTTQDNALPRSVLVRLDFVETTGESSHPPVEICVNLKTQSAAPEETSAEEAEAQESN